MTNKEIAEVLMAPDHESYCKRQSLDKCPFDCYSSDNCRGMFELIRKDKEICMLCRHGKYESTQPVCQACKHNGVDKVDNFSPEDEPVVIKEE